MIVLKGKTIKTFFLQINRYIRVTVLKARSRV